MHWGGDAQIRYTANAISGADALVEVRRLAGSTQMQADRRRDLPSEAPDRVEGRVGSRSLGVGRKARLYVPNQSGYMFSGDGAATLGGGT